jgi:hypothetical protein
MPIGPKGQKRPRDPNQLAKLIVDIATGQVKDRGPTPEEQGKDPARRLDLTRLAFIKGCRVRRHAWRGA